MSRAWLGSSREVLALLTSPVRRGLPIPVETKNVPCLENSPACGASNKGRFSGFSPNQRMSRIEDLALSSWLRLRESLERRRSFTPPFRQHLSLQVHTTRRVHPAC
jgi:hypothetical protein